MSIVYLSSGLVLVNWEHLQFFVPFSSIYNFGVLQSALIFFLKK